MYFFFLNFLPTFLPNLRKTSELPLTYCPEFCPDFRRSLTSRHGRCNRRERRAGAPPTRTWSHTPWRKWRTAAGRSWWSAISSRETFTTVLTGSWKGTNPYQASLSLSPSHHVERFFFFRFFPCFVIICFVPCFALKKMARMSKFRVKKLFFYSHSLYKSEKTHTHMFYPYMLIHQIRFSGVDLIKPLSSTLSPLVHFKHRPPCLPCMLYVICCLLKSDVRKTPVWKSSVRKILFSNPRWVLILLWSWSMLCCWCCCCLWKNRSCVTDNKLMYFFSPQLTCDERCDHVVAPPPRA